MGGACFLRHQLAAVFNASDDVRNFTYQQGEEGDFCDAMPMYPCNVTKIALSLRAKMKSLG